MGYKKIVQYGNVTEVYDYENNLKTKKPDAKRAWILADGRGGNRQSTSLTLAQKRNRAQKEEAKCKGIYKRSQRSINRSRGNFFRLVHHNNIHSASIHFVTLTFAYDLSYKTASRHVSEFFRRVQKTFPEIPLRYISVPELTEAGRFHFHLLFYDLPPEAPERERETRNFQRLFERGYVDISPATYTSKGIAGYMAKYMAKTFEDARYETTRGYNCSRNIKKITSAGGNTLDQYSDMIVPTEGVEDFEEREYDVPYLGACRFTKITTSV